jgi:sigma-B regulation protein RsbU (phosphoserine phosphatase)
MDDRPYPQAEITFEDGDRLYLYTDGINEAKNAMGAQFGNERMLETANANRELAPCEFDGAMRRAVDLFVGGAEQSDDITTLAFLLRRKDA